MAWKVLKLARGESGPAWAGEIAAGHWRGATALKTDEGVIVRAAPMCGGEVVIKAWRLDGPGRVKSWLRMSRGARHWRGAVALAGAGVQTARPIALLRSGGDEVLVMDRLAGPTLLEVLARPPGRVREQHALAAQVGKNVAAFGDLFNRDHKPSNLIVLGDRGNLSLAVIDTVAIHRSKPDSSARMLASLVLEPAGCGCSPRLSLRMQALTAYLAARRNVTKGARNALWKQVAAIVQAHGDPTPRVNPLAAAKPAIRP